jgi:hypothetical protein
MDRQRAQLDENYDAFVRRLADLLPEHRDTHALMRNGEIVGFYDKPGDAWRAGVAMFADGLFSIQEVTDEPIDLGFWTHVAPH